MAYLLTNKHFSTYSKCQEIQEIQLPSLSKAILKCREIVQKLAIQLPVSQFNYSTSCVTVTVRDGNDAYMAR